MKKLLLIVILTANGAINAFASNNEPKAKNKEGNNTKEVKLKVSKSTGCAIRYHYFPNMQAYYDLKEKIYYFQMDGEWFTADSLPTNYGGYSLYKNEKVQITDYEGDKPETMIKIHAKAFPYNAKGRIQRPAENSIGNEILSNQIALN